MTSLFTLDVQLIQGSLCRTNDVEIRDSFISFCEITLMLPNVLKSLQGELLFHDERSITLIGIDGENDAN